MAEFLQRERTSRRRGGVGGWCRRPRCRSTWPSARPTRGACSSRRWRRAWASPASRARCRSPSGSSCSGLSAALFGTRVDANGPRWAMVMSSSCFVSGFLISALGLLPAAVLAGRGRLRVRRRDRAGHRLHLAGLHADQVVPGPARPVHRIAIMGFGGGALIASPLTNQLLAAFGGSGATPDVNGIAQTFLVMGLIYAVFMSVGWLLIRVPAGRTGGPRGGPGARQDRHADTTANVSARNAIRTPQFWLLWVVLCFNVTAGIGILERAAPICSDFFPDATSPRRWRPPPRASSRCCRSPTPWAGSCGRRRRTSWAARTCTGSTSASARCSTWRSRC